MQKERVDVLLVERGLATSREHAKRLVMAGLVYDGTTAVDKPGCKMSSDAALRVKGALHPFVSRGGVKLEHALATFPVSLVGAVVIDVGASTGGFTDCALQHGASLVHSVDVGYGQLAWSLRNDTRVRVWERTNFRLIDSQSFVPKPNRAVMDVSFISVGKLFPKLKEVLVPGSPVITLVKPQFEAGPESVGKGGIVRQPEVHEAVLRQVIAQSLRLGFKPEGLTHSPIKGGDGNVEFLLWLTSPNEDDQSVMACETVATNDLGVTNIVKQAHDLAT